MKNSEKLFREAGYSKRERYAGEEFIDGDGAFAIYFHNNKLIQITDAGDHILELLPDEIEAMYAYCKEQKWIK